MSYSVVAYLTDAKEIKNLYGSKDEALLSFLLDKLSHELDELNDEFDFDSNINNEKNSQEVLTDIINGEIRFPEIAYIYGYVYEKLCQYFGEMIIPPNDEFSTNHYMEVTKSAYKAFIPIPFSSDFPEIYSIPVSELISEKNKFLNVSRIGDIDDELLQLEKEDFEFTFDKAVKENKDLVFLLY